MERRTFLAGVAGVAAASSVGLAGCVGDSDGGAPEDWIPGPEVFEVEGYRAFSTSPSTIAEYRDSLTPSVVEEYESLILDWEVADPGLDDVARYTSGGTDQAGYIAVEHGLDEGMLASNLESDGFAGAGEYEGFDVYEAGGGASARALDGDRLVAASTPDDGTAIVEGVIDAGNGDADSYDEADDAVADVVKTIDTTDNFWLEGYQRITNTIAARGVFTDSVARGYSILLDDETVEASRVEVFVEDADVEESAITTYTEENPLFDGAQGLDWRVDGRMLVIEWTADPGALSLRQLG
ncbi:hypothetical protein BRD08_06145 [Halobacteriales archaeon SW_10_66_29]|nr:MAG: hypothetical protein BRD08_06145 [Halobacteriales archaeon SW_10_66_29]